MTKKESKRFSVEEKRAILARFKVGESPADLAALYNITPRTIYHWRRQLREAELDVAVEKAPRVVTEGVNPKYVRELEEKLRAANERLGALYIIVEDLKKMGQPTTNASSYIATRRPWGQSKRRVK